jgi:hypothetical protein
MLLMDKEGLVEILSQTLEELKGLDQKDFAFDLTIVGIDHRFAERAPALQKILAEETKKYILRRNKGQTSA